MAEIQAARQRLLSGPPADPLYDELAELGAPIASITEKLRAKGLRVPEFRPYRRRAA
ncbi:hypothetical protein KBY91_19160 [Streptomyces sp. RK23]|uniref:hypothetical protein n=1 Tax=unclassified Streptomyces TaxID=2593676 RepID=UPI001B37067D|nr:MULTISPECIES: hypothetical protein [unclassified Streptomyces]MBQ0963470.1 hypothetical protein [Streptomyces sp. RK74B]MBQ1005526.1 hypothetical protein [Streptomyces sp. RK23]